MALTEHHWHAQITYSRNFTKDLVIMYKKHILFALAIFTIYSSTAAQHNEAEDPDPLRFEEQIEQFKAWDKKNSFPSDAILFVGSSSIRLWDTAAAFPDLPVINRGFGGSHISDVQHYYETVLNKYDPALIVFYEGDNDIAADKPIEQVFGDYRQLVERILDDQPDADFLYIPIKPSNSRWNYWSKMNEVNELIKDYNSKNDRLHYVDLASPILKNDGTPDDSFFLEDQLHLNEKGYEQWNENIEPVLERFVP